MPETWLQNCVCFETRPVVEPLCMSRSIMLRAADTHTGSKEAKHAEIAWRCEHGGTEVAERVRGARGVREGVCDATGRRVVGEGGVGAEHVAAHNERAKRSGARLRHLGVLCTAREIHARCNLLKVE